MTAPALTGLATSDHRPWCTFHDNGTCYSAPDLIQALDGRHFGTITVEQPDDGPAVAAVDFGSFELDEAGLLDLAAKAAAAAARIAEARR